jgi:hypothetical protein
MMSDVVHVQAWCRPTSSDVARYTGSGCELQYANGAVGGSDHRFRQQYVSSEERTLMRFTRSAPIILRLASRWFIVALVAISGFPALDVIVATCLPR